MLPNPMSTRATIFVCTFAGATALMPAVTRGLKPLDGSAATDLIVGALAEAFTPSTGGWGLALGDALRGTAAGVAFPWFSVVAFLDVDLIELVAGAGDFVFVLVFFIAVIFVLESG